MRNFILLCFTVACFSALGNVHADFSASKFNSCPPVTDTFADKSTGNVTAWHWDFGNGNSSTLQNPSATYLTSGKYPVKLVVSNSTSSDSVIKIVQVFVVPLVSFSAQNTKVCLTDTVIFTSSVKPGSSPVLSYAWGFGDGKASSGQNVSYRYALPGVYAITLVVQDSNGCNANKTVPKYITVYPMPKAVFTASPLSSCNATQTVTFTNSSTGTGLTYLWNLDTAATSILQNPTYTYTQQAYTVTLLVTDSNGCKSVASKLVSAKELVANFKASKLKPCTGQTVQFQNTSNFTGTTWFWDFGNGLTSITNNPSTIYTDTGTYTVSFVVYDGACSDSITKTQYIHVINGFSSNQATFAADTTTTCGQPINVNFSNTTPGTDNSDMYHWVFGNGDTSDVQNPSEHYAGPGDYNVSLTITDSNGCVITEQAGSFIKTNPPAPKFKVIAGGCPGSPISFSNTSTDAVSYLWNFGDGDTSSAKSPSHIYSNDSSYNVTLTAYGVGGCDSSLTIAAAVTIGALPASFVIQDTFSPCPPFVTIFKNTTAPGVKSFLWNFGDGYTDTAANPTHIYYYPGVYSVSLLAYQTNVCKDTMVRPNLITVQGPTGNFSITPTKGCVPLQVHVSSSMSNTVKTFSCDMGDGSVIGDTTIFSHTYVQPRSYYPQFILTDYAGCAISYPLDTVIAYGHPAFSVRDTSVCAGMAAQVTISTDSNSYRWSPASYITCDTCYSVIINAPDTTVYQVTGTNQWGCQTTNTVHINVEPLPAISDSVSFSLCKNDNMQLSVGNGGYRYAWSPALYLSDSSSANPVCTPLSSVVYSVDAFNVLGCFVHTTVAIHVGDSVHITLPADTTACMDGSITLNTTLVFGSALGVQYSWSPAEYLNNPYIANPVASLSDKTTVFTVIATSGHCAADTETISVTITPLPDIEVSQSLITTPGAEVSLYAASHEDLTYQWIAKDSFSCADCRRTDLFPNSSQIVYVHGTNRLGCTITDSLTVTVEGCDGKSIFMPNTFTPNGDGIDDKFYIRTAALSSLKFFRIFDSWGQQVFETNNMSEGWDGTINGKQGPIAVYVYELEGVCQNGGSVFKSGNITAVR